MEITPQLVNSLPKLTADTLALLKQLQPGQLLDAIVKNISTENLVKLQIGTNTLTASSNTQLSVGDQLKLEVAKLAPQVELKIIRAPVAETTQQQILRLALPKQLPLNQVTQQLLPLIKQPMTSGISPEITQSVERFLQAQAITPDKLSAGNIVKAFENSGLLGEAKLIRGDNLAPQDMKFAVIKLLSQINTMVAAGRNPQGVVGTPNTGGLSPQASPISPAVSAASMTEAIKLALQQHLLPKTNMHRPVSPEMSETATATAGASPATQPQGGLVMQIIRLLEGTLARTQLHQLSSLPPDDGIKQIWQFEIPLRFVDQYDAVLVRFEKEQQQQAEQDAEWRVTLEFDFAQTGKIQARLRIVGEQVSANFWCENAKTNQNIASKLPTLDEMLINAGLVSGQLHTCHGQAPEDISVIPQEQDGVFYEKA